MEDGKGHFEFASVIRGHHVYKVIWLPQLGETLFLALEPENVHDRHAVSVKKRDVVV